MTRGSTRTTIVPDSSEPHPSSVFRCPQFTLDAAKVDGETAFWIARDGNKVWMRRFWCGIDVVNDHQVLVIRPTRIVPGDHGFEALNGAWLGVSSTAYTPGVRRDGRIEIILAQAESLKPHVTREPHTFVHMDDEFRVVVIREADD